MLFNTLSQNKQKVEMTNVPFSKKNRFASLLRPLKVTCNEVVNDIANADSTLSECAASSVNVVDDVHIATNLAVATGNNSANNAVNVDDNSEPFASKRKVGIAYIATNLAVASGNDTANNPVNDDANLAPVVSKGKVSGNIGDTNSAVILCNEVALDALSKQWKSKGKVSVTSDVGSVVNPNTGPCNEQAFLAPNASCYHLNMVMIM